MFGKIKILNLGHFNVLLSEPVHPAASDRDQRKAKEISMVNTNKDMYKVLSEFFKTGQAYSMAGLSCGSECENLDPLQYTENI